MKDAAHIYTPDNLIAGTFPQTLDVGTLAAGESITRGAVLGKVTADGTLKLCAGASSDGSEIPYCIASGDVDASAGENPITYFLSGEFNQNVMTIGTGYTLDDVKDDCRDRSIYLRTAKKVD